MFALTDELTPVIMTVSPSRGLRGDDTITITGQRFSDRADDITVTIESAQCTVRSSSLTQVQSLGVPMLIRIAFRNISFR